MRRFALVGVLLAGVPASAFDSLLAGSAAVDYRLAFGRNPPENPSPFGINGLTLEVAQKVVVDVGRGVSFSVKACGGCHGLEVDQAYGELHVKRAFNLRAGRLNVPFGEFTVRHDPVNFITPSKPLPYAMGDMLQYTRQGFNLGIMPAPWVDNGAEVFGSVSFGPRAQLDYAVYAVKGPAGDNDLDFQRSRGYVDNNRTPTFGARLVLTGDDWAFGGSGAAGAYDSRDRLWFMMGGVEGYLRFGRVTLRVEALARRTDLDPDEPSYAFVLIDPWFLKLGWYAQLDFQVTPQLTLVARSDGLQRFGMPLPFSDLTTTSSGVLRQTLSGMFRINDNFAFKAGYELWTFSGAPFPLTHVARVSLVAGY